MSLKANQSSLSALKQMNNELSNSPVVVDIVPTTETIITKYSGSIRKIVSEIAKDIKKSLIPEIKRLKQDYMDSTSSVDLAISEALISDSWVDVIALKLAAINEKYTDSEFNSYATFIATKYIKLQGRRATKDFIKEIKKITTINVDRLLTKEGIAEYIEASIKENVALIKSVAEQYLKSVETTIYSAMKNGQYPSAIIEDIQDATGVSWRRARNIANDQLLKVKADVNAIRNTNLGVTHYKWSTSKDEKVSGRPGGINENAKIKCFMIANRDIGFGKGVYSFKDGAAYAGETGLQPAHAHVNCRCTALTLIKGINWDGKEVI